MKHLKTILAASSIGLILLLSCGKDDTPGQPAESKFTWSYNGTNYVAKTHIAHMNGIGSPSIVASLQTGTGSFINLSSLQQGTYAILINGANMFSYVDEAGDIQAGTSGSLNITKNTGTLVSGNFSVTLTNSKTITGEFVNTAIRP
jgi:hypothetical protein